MKQKNLILDFLKANKGGEFTVVEIAKAIVDGGQDYINYYTESQVKHELKTGDGLANVKFIHSRETTAGDFAYEAFTYRKGANSKELDFSSRTDGKTTRADLVADLAILLNILETASAEAHTVREQGLGIVEESLKNERVYSGAVHSSIGRLTAMLAFAKGEEVK